MARKIDKITKEKGIQGNVFCNNCGIEFKYEIENPLRLCKNCWIEEYKREDTQL